jgi:NhaP-type Na+/H+ or K+/H+ antiporter
VHPLAGTIVALGAAGGGGFDHAVLVLGGLLAAGALISGLAHRSFLSLTALFVLAGLALGKGGAGVLSFDPSSSFVGDLTLVALIVLLFRDGLEVDSEMLATEWRLPLRKLVLAMPLTGALIALATKSLTDLGWTQSFLLGALLSPTDPVLSSFVVTDPRVPRIVRHSLNLESGMNDGLALPAVLAFTAALGSSQHHFVWWHFLLRDVSLGLVFGIVVGVAAAFLMPRVSALADEIPPHAKALYALGVGFAAYGVARLPPRGNGFIAVFVAAIAFGILRPDLRQYFSRRSEEIVEVVKLAVFVVFGSLLTLHALFADGWAAVAIVAFTLLIARPVAVFAALTGTGVDRSSKLFMSWFGPKGVATMTFSLLVLNASVPGGRRLFDICALAVFTSILAHGATDVAGAKWIARRTHRGQAAVRR